MPNIAEKQIYKDQGPDGGDVEVIPSGAQITVESGGAIDIESGAAFEIAGADISADLAAAEGLAAEFALIDGLTAEAAELNKLNGATVTVAEINVLDNILAGATIVVGAEGGGTTINVTIQFTDADGNDMATPVSCTWYLADDAAGLDPASVAHSTSPAIGADGALIQTLADLAGIIISEADGDVDIDFVEAGALTKYLVLVMPNGSLVISDAITHAP